MFLNVCVYVGQEEGTFPERGLSLDGHVWQMTRYDTMGHRGCFSRAFQNWNIRLNIIYSFTNYNYPDVTDELQ